MAIGADSSESVKALSGALGRVLLEERKARGLLRRELAETAGLSARGIEYVEKGARAVGVPALFAIAGGLKVPASELLARAERLIAEPHRHNWQPSSMFDTGHQPERQRWDCWCGAEAWDAEEPCVEAPDGAGAP